MEGETVNRYVGNSGGVWHIPEEKPSFAGEDFAEGPVGRAEYRKPPGQPGILSGLGGLLSKAKKSVPETEDLILVAVLYLMYRESGDIEFLLIAGAMLFL